MILNPKVIGIAAGLVIGVVWLWFGPLKAFLLALFVLAGWVISKFWTGEIDVLGLYARFMQGRGRRLRR